MKIDCTINLIDLLTLISSIVIAIIGICLSKKISAKQKFEHEKNIYSEIGKILKFGKSFILLDVKKEHKEDSHNKSYRKQKAQFYDVMPAVGLRCILRGSDEKIPIATIPFEWIEYIRLYDSEDYKPIIVCKFKGHKWYANFKSPFIKIDYFYKNNNYNEDQPEIFRYTSFKSKI